MTKSKQIKAAKECIGDVKKDIEDIDDDINVYTAKYFMIFFLH